MHRSHFFVVHCLCRVHHYNKLLTLTFHLYHITMKCITFKQTAQGKTCESQLGVILHPLLVTEFTCPLSNYSFTYSNTFPPLPYANHRNTDAKSCFPKLWFAIPLVICSHLFEICLFIKQIGPTVSTQYLHDSPTLWSVTESEYCPELPWAQSK